MTPKEKASELYAKFRIRQTGEQSAMESIHQTLACCNIVADEMLSEMNCTHIGYGKQVMSSYRKKKTEYWQQVKAEIEKL